MEKTTACKTKAKAPVKVIASKAPARATAAKSIVAKTPATVKTTVSANSVARASVAKVTTKAATQAKEAAIKSKMPMEKTKVSQGVKEVSKLGVAPVSEISGESVASAGFPSADSAVSSASITPSAAGIPNSNGATSDGRRKRSDKNKGESQSQAKHYVKGDVVVYPGKGVVTITGYENYEVDGQRQTFVVLKNQKTPPVKILVPLTKMDKVNLRDIVDAAMVREVYRILKEKSNFSESGTWNRRFRDYTEKIKSGDILKLAVVLRDLSRQKLVKEPSFGERKMLDQVSDLLVTELSLAKHCTEEDIQNEFKRIFSKGKTAAVEQDEEDEDEDEKEEESSEEEEN